MTNTVLPHSYEAEKAVLGAVLQDNAVIEEAGILTPEHFFNMQYGLVWGAMWRLWQAHRPIDPTTVSEEMNDRNGLAGELRNISIETPSSLNITGYAQQVHDMATRRALVEAGQSLARFGHADFMPVGDALENSAQALDAVVDGHVSVYDSTQHVREIAGDVAEEAAIWKNDPNSIRGIETGLGPVDEMLGGIQEGELLSIAGRPGQGKSALLGRLAWGISSKNRPVLLFSLEMTGKAMIRRMACQMSHVSATLLKAGKLSAPDYQLFLNAVDEIATYPLFVAARAGLSVREMQAIARRFDRRYGLAVVMIDTFNRVKGTGGSQYEITTNKSHDIADWAHNSTYAIMQAVQLSRVNERSQDKRPTLDGLRDSGAVEEDNDIVMGLYRPFYYDRDNKELEHEAELKMLKFRDGDSDARALLYWRSECLSFDRGERRNLLDDDQMILGRNTH